LKANKKPLGVQ